MTEKNKNRNTALKLGLASLIMFGFGYALVPLYDVFCEFTGLNGKTGQIAAASTERIVVDKTRLVMVEFDTNVNSDLPWKFRALERRMEVHPGQVYEAVFYVENESDQHIVGQAVPSVAPSSGSRYFDKTECFCFTRQPLAPGESKNMPVRFVIDPAMPGHISTLTLSYTFFPIPGGVTAVTEKSEPNS